MSASTFDWGLFYVLGILAAFISWHNTITPTPEEDKEYRKTHYILNPVHPDPMTPEQCERRTRDTKRLRHTGWIGLVLTVAVFIVTLLPFMQESIFGQLPIALVSSFVFFIILLMQFFVEKRLFGKVLSKEQLLES